MKTYKGILSLAILVLSLGYFAVVSCEKDIAVETTEDNVEDFDILLRAKDKCLNPLLNEGKLVCAKAETAEQAAKELGAKVRFECMGMCLGQDCNNDENKCSLKKISQLTKATEPEECEVVDPETGEPKILFQVCATFRCLCHCVSCNGAKNVGVVRSATAPTEAAAEAMAKQAGQAWCGSFGCPSFKGCKESFSCKSTGKIKFNKLSVKDVPPPGQIPPPPGIFFKEVRLLITSCNCKCKG